MNFCSKFRFIASTEVIGMRKMFKKSIIRSVCLAFWFLTVVCYAGDESKIDVPAFKRIAVMPFLIGKLESPDKPTEKPLSQPLLRLLPDEFNIIEGADQVMTRLVNDALRVKYQERLISAETVVQVYTAVSSDSALDTPRKLAVRLGEALNAELVVVGTVWRFREKGTESISAAGVASVAFSVYLVEVASGKRLWRGAFDGTQKALSEDILGGLKQIKMGLVWLSAGELARYGVKNVFRKFPLR